LKLPTELGIIVLAFNEVDSLDETISKIQTYLSEIEYEIVISTSNQATIECQNMAKHLARKYNKVSCYFQVKPFVAAAVLEVAQNMDTEFLVYMSADGETPAEAIPRMLEVQRLSDADVVSTSRWIKGGSFTNYGGAKYLTSLLAQQLCRLIYQSRLTEFTYGFRLYRSEILKNYNYREVRHPFFLETLLVPLRLGYKIREIPVKWVPRVEGETVVTLTTLISYLRPLIFTRIQTKRTLNSKQKRKIV
jgi:glycosyltransferase involved in cell wall biosynthesis